MTATEPAAPAATGAAPAAPPLPGEERSYPRWLDPVGFLAAAVALLVVAPAALSQFRLELLARYLCFAIVAVGIAVAWGRGGMLTLGQGVFFGLGGYSFGMYLKLEAAGEGNLPDFMAWSGVQTLPLLWRPFANPVFALAMVVVLPVTVATLLGLLVFKRRVRGAYFAILTQALTAAFVILLVGQQGLTGGTNGLTNIADVFGLNRYDPRHQLILYVVVVVTLGVVFLLAWQLTHSRLGKLLVAIRDGEDRVRFLGYDPAVVKTVAFAFSAGVAGVAGALFVPVVGILGPADIDVVSSIMMLLAVAIGGRYSLVGAVAGALLVNYASSLLSEALADRWLYLFGALLVVVILWAPRGLAGLVADGRDALVRVLRGRRSA